MCNARMDIFTIIFKIILEQKKFIFLPVMFILIGIGFLLLFGFGPTDKPFTYLGF